MNAAKLAEFEAQLKQAQENLAAAQKRVGTLSKTVELLRSLSKDETAAGFVAAALADEPTPEPEK